MAEQKSKFWLDLVVDEIIKKYPKGEIVLSSGISPSAEYHIGHFREILTVDAITWGLRKAGRKARHIHVVDNFDPLRKRYNFLPKRFESHVGKPVCLIPDPEGECHRTYADHFYSEFEIYARQMGIHPDRVVKSYEDLYRVGSMAPQVERVLIKIDEVKEIYERVANRQLSAEWTPVQVLDGEQHFFNAELSSWQRDKKIIGGANYAKGKAKLNWRLDWPARWQVLGVMVEPYGRELASAGSARDTGVEFARKVFGFEPPIPGVEYEPIHLAGDSKKMSSSLGNLVTPKDALAIMPPEILRYFVVRSRPDHKLYFDPGEGLYNLIDEFSQIESNPNHEFKEAYEFAIDIKKGNKQRIISSVPFRHLVFVWQTAQKRPDKVFRILERTGYKKEAKEQNLIIKDELEFIDNWLARHASEDIKFEIQKKLPDIKIDGKRALFLDRLAEVIAAKSDKKVDAKWFHETIYKLSNEVGLRSKDVFECIYLVTLGKPSGPRAGWLLADLDRKFIIRRFKEASRIG